MDEHFDWLFSVPSSDENFKIHLKEASVETLKLVLFNKIGKTKRKVIEVELKGRELKMIKKEFNQKIWIYTLLVLMAGIMIGVVWTAFFSCVYGYWC